MRLPNFRRIFDQDYKAEEKELVNKLAVTINNGFEVLYQALSKRLTFQDNFLATVTTVDLSVNASGTPTTTTAFKLDSSQSNARVVGVLVIRAENLTNTSLYPSSAPFISWSQTETGVSINNVTGLQSGNLYRLTVLAI